MSNNIIVKDTWVMPAVNEETTLVLQACGDLLVGCWIWNESVGYLQVTEYKGYDIYVTVKNIGRLENAKEGTVFPSCMEFIVGAPDSLPLYDNTVTCLMADFISPAVGETAVMVVEDTSNIRESDIIIVDRQYRYTVIEILTEHNLLVSNEGYGKEGIITSECGRCVPVKILESTACCKVVRDELQEEIDDIYDRLNTKKSIKPWSGNNLVTITGGDDALTDADFDATIKVDNHLSNYINDTNYATVSQLPTVNNGTLTINNSDGTNFVTFKANDASSPTVTLPPINNGTLTIQQNGTTIDTFTANSSANKTINITVPSVPTVPSQYSGYTSGANLMKSEYSPSLDYTLKSNKTSGSAESISKDISSHFPTITLASPSTNGRNIIIFGSVFAVCEGTFRADTHTYPDGGYHSLVTAKGPSTEFKVKPIIDNVDVFSTDVYSGSDYHFVLDILGTKDAPTNTKFSQQVTIPIIYEVDPSTSHTLTFTSSVTARGLREAGGSSSDGNQFFNEPVRVSLTHLYIKVALGWVLK
jgi:hypothetical protein